MLVVYSRSLGTSNFFLLILSRKTVRILFHRQQFEKMMPKPDVNMEVNKRGCCINALFKSSEQMIYQEYVICLKKYQLALE